MKLRCELKGVKCPRYKHYGFFYPDDQTIKRLLPDANRCAECIAFTSPQRPDIQEDLQQTAVLVLIEKGPRFSPTHASGANFGTFIRPRICGTLMNTKSRELTRNSRESSNFEVEWNPSETIDTKIHRAISSLWSTQVLHTEFEDELVRDLSFRDALPELLKTLTPREREVFSCLRDNQRNCEIAEALNLTESRVSQLVTQVMRKVEDTGQRLGLSE